MPMSRKETIEAIAKKIYCGATKKDWVRHPNNFQLARQAHFEQIAESALELIEDNMLDYKWKE